jgi:hypothetical protein
MAPMTRGALQSASLFVGATQLPCKRTYDVTMRSSDLVRENVRPCLLCTRDRSLLPLIPYDISANTPRLMHRTPV